MPAFVENDIFSEDLSEKVHNLDTDTFRWVLSNTAPNIATTNLLSNITQISTGNGYTQMTDGAGGVLTDTSTGRSGQITTITTTQVVVTATGAVGPFQWLFLVNDTPTSPLNPVIG